MSAATPDNKRQGASAKCPFCGSKPAALFFRSVKRGGDLKVQACCPNCQADGPVAKTQEEAEDNWNARPAHPIKALFFGS